MRKEDICPTCGWRPKGSLASECAHCATLRRVRNQPKLKKGV